MVRLITKEIEIEESLKKKIEELIYLIGIKAMIMMIKSKKILMMVWNYK